MIPAKQASGRVFDATEQMARTRAIRSAVAGIIEKRELIGAVANNWDEEPWAARGYFASDPGSVGEALGAAISAGAPRLAILRTDVLPAVGGDAATRKHRRRPAQP